MRQSARTPAHGVRETDRLRVCHVLHTLGPGGAQELVVTLAGQARAAGIELSVLALGPAAGDVADALARLGVTVVSTELAWAGDPRAAVRALAALRALSPDVLHSHGKRADVVGAYAAGRLRCPHVSTLHLIEDAQDPLRQGVTRAAARVRQRSCARVVTVSDAQRRWYVGAFAARTADKVVTIHNGVPAPPVPGPEERARVRAELGVPEDAVLALALGLLRADRGHQHLIDAAALVTQRDVHVVVAGDGPLRAVLEAQVEQRRGIGACVHFAGFRRDVGRLLAGADMVVHPSLADALPTALMHALAARRSVVASDVGGIAEIVTADCGVLVPPADPPALAAAVEALARDPHRRHEMGRAGQARFQQHFTAHAWVTSLRALYAQVLSEAILASRGH